MRILWIMSVPLLLLKSILAGKEATFTISVLIPFSYIQLAQSTHPDLFTELKTAAMTLQTAYNASTYASNNGYKITIVLDLSEDSPAIGLVNESVCEGPVTNVVTMLDKINSLDNMNHYIALLPCLPNIYEEVFNSMDIPVPVIDHRTNVQCSKRVAIFYEKTTATLLASFSNAILKVLVPCDEDYLSFTERTDGDFGVKDVLNLKDSTVADIANSKCFNQVKGTFL